jgi:2-C-methyl-D-erythritol 2,4-cyclodiphosphate synthase
VNLRVGQGFDIHPFSDDPTRKLVLGGVHVEGRGLAGHSDGDVICHAVADALLGASGLGDIGTLFPDTDPSLAGADSLGLLARVLKKLGNEWRPINVDCTVIAETPKLSPYMHAMENKLGTLVAAPVSVKAKRGEGLGALGRKEGIACIAVALIEEK